MREWIATSNPAMVTVRLKRGAWEVEITCPEDRVKQIVENVLAGLDTSIQQEPIATVSVPTIAEPVVEKRKDQHVICRDLLLVLWQEGWFSSERNLTEVYEELARRGYHYDKTSISHSLADLVRENILTRIGTMRNYRYVQKRPPKS
ncbi:MAG: hypothetical protein HYU02_08260 [Thaumarchaeota archaeon]|nr:hypothetical protein [Nitrososphaerota archaeon]